MGNRLFFVFQKEFKNALAEAMRSSEYLGLPDSVQGNLEGILESLHGFFIGGLIKKAGRDNGTKVIENLLAIGGHNGKVLDNIEAIYTNDNALQDHQKLGNSLLNFVFDEDVSEVYENSLSYFVQEFGISLEALKLINRSVIPFSMGIIGKEMLSSTQAETGLELALKGNIPILMEKFPKMAGLLNLGESDAIKLTAEKNTNTSTPDSKIVQDAKDEGATKKMGNQGLVTLNIQVFYKNFFPWLATFLISAGSLYALRYFETKEEAVSILQAKNSPFNFIQNDSLDVKSFSEVPWIDTPAAVIGNGYLDSLNRSIENQSLVESVVFSDANLHFEENAANISMEGKQELDEILAVLKKYDFLHLDIEVGGSESFVQTNKDLIDKRMRNIQDYFVVFGIESKRISIDYLVANTAIKADSLKTLTVDSVKMKAQSSNLGAGSTAIHFRFSNQEKNI